MLLMKISLISHRYFTKLLKYLIKLIVKYFSKFYLIVVEAETKYMIIREMASILDTEVRTQRIFLNNRK
jgi:hypothetical protein